MPVEASGWCPSGSYSDNRGGGRSLAVCSEGRAAQHSRVIHSKASGMIDEARSCISDPFRGAGCRRRGLFEVR